uniref:COX assembly mitochondrial protein n=1 Tax=Strigamia maritima TaxID=126957 RepID=T1J2A2_STRMM
MHPDLSPHLHTEECNNLIRELQQCHEQKKFTKFLGACNEANSKLLRCLKNE